MFKGQVTKGASRVPVVLGTESGKGGTDAGFMYLTASGFPQRKSQRMVAGQLAEANSVDFRS